MDALLEAVKLLKPAAVIDGKAQLTALINRGRWQRYLKGMKSRKKMTRIIRICQVLAALRTRRFGQTLPFNRFRFEEIGQKTYQKTSENFKQGRYSCYSVLLLKTKVHNKQ